LEEPTKALRSVALTNIRFRAVNDASSRPPGHLLASTLAGSWRTSKSELTISNQELNEITPLLVRSGAAALVWWQIRNCELASLPRALQLRETYYSSAIHAALQ